MLEELIKRIYCLERISKFFISGDIVSQSRDFLVLMLLRHNGKFYVDIRDFSSVSWMRLDREKTTRQIFAYSISKFCRFKNCLPDDLIEEYKVDESKVITDLKSFFSFLSEHRYRVEAI